MFERSFLAAQSNLAQMFLHPFEISGGAFDLHLSAAQM